MLTLPEARSGKSLQAAFAVPMLPRVCRVSWAVVSPASTGVHSRSAPAGHFLCQVRRKESAGRTHLRMGAGGEDKTCQYSNAANAPIDVGCSLPQSGETLGGWRLSRRSAVGVAGLVGILVFPLRDDSSLASILPPKDPAKVVVEAAKKKEAKAISESKSVDAQLRKQLVQMKKNLETDLKTLQSGLDKRLTSLEQMLVEGNENDVLPVSDADARRLDRTLRKQAKGLTEILEDSIVKMDGRITQLDSDVAQKRYQQDFLNKKKELAGQLRAVAKKVHLFLRIPLPHSSLSCTQPLPPPLTHASSSPISLSSPSSATAFVLLTFYEVYAYVACTDTKVWRLG